MRRYIIFVLAGWTLWAALFAIGYPYVYGSDVLPKLPGAIGFPAAVASIPIGFGGWVYVWGDGPGQPPSWTGERWFSVAFGLLLYGALGAAVGMFSGRLRKRREL